MESSPALSTESSRIPHKEDRYRASFNSLSGTRCCWSQRPNFAISRTLSQPVTLQYPCCETSAAKPSKCGPIGPACKRCRSSGRGSKRTIIVSFLSFEVEVKKQMTRDVAEATSADLFHFLRMLV